MRKYISVSFILNLLILCCMVYLVFGCASIWKKGFDSIFPPEIQDKKRIDTSKIPLTSALVLGDLKAEKKVIIFADPDCPYCSNLYKVIKRIIDKRKDITFYIKMYPLKSHKDAYWKSKSIVCNNSLQMLQDCFDKKEIAKTDCKTDEVDNTLKLAKSLGITGTPAIILPDGRLRLGTMPETELTKLIDGKI